MAQIFGDYNETYFSNSNENETDREFLILGFSPNSIPLKQRWRNNGLSANFLGDYLTAFFPVSDDEINSLKKHKRVKGATSYIANELLENAMKYHDPTSKHTINIRMQLYPDRIVLAVTNGIAPQAVAPFQGFIKKLMSSDPNELYLSTLEKNAEDENSTTSGLGLLTMINDYMAKIGWKFETLPGEPQTMIVTTMVQIPI